MAEEARRSIDEIIGSIRSIMEPGGRAANDDGAGDLTDLPPHTPPPSSLAEPVASRTTRSQMAPHAVIDAAPAALDAADAVRMAQIAETVNRNLADATPASAAAASAVEDVPVVEPPANSRPSERVRAMEIDDDAIVASFGRRTAAPRPDGPDRRPGERTVFADRGADAPPGRSDDGRDDLRPMHDRFAAIGEVVEEAVTARGVVRAANDAAPSAVAPTPAVAPAPPITPAPAFVPPALPAAPGAPQAHVPPPEVADPVLDDATLRPIIREWLDDNLPPLVERLVREELQKAIHGGRRGR